MDFPPSGREAEAECPVKTVSSSEDQSARSPPTDPQTTLPADAPVEAIHAATASADDSSSSPSQSPTTSASSLQPIQSDSVKLRTKEEEERLAWCKKYDEAQPSGKSMSASDPEFLMIMKDFERRKATGDVCLPPPQDIFHNPAVSIFKFWKRTKRQNKKQEAWPGMTGAGEA